MDSYIWFVEYIKGKLKYFKGEQNCALTTYIWSVINSEYTFKDWLRWKYGRKDSIFTDTAFKRLPSFIKKLDRNHQKVFLCLRMRKGQGEIANLLKLSIEEIKLKEWKIREILNKEEELHLIEDPSILSIHTDGHEGEEIPIPTKGSSMAETLVKAEYLDLLKQILDDLPMWRSNLTRLRYKNRMSARDLILFLQKNSVTVHLPPAEHNRLIIMG